GVSTTSRQAGQVLASTSLTGRLSAIRSAPDLATFSTRTEPAPAKASVCSSVVHEIQPLLALRPVTAQPAHSDVPPQLCCDPLARSTTWSCWGESMPEATASWRPLGDRASPHALAPFSR